MTITVSADIFAKLSASIDSLTEQQQKHNVLMRQIQAALTHIPNDQPIAGSATTNATGAVTFGCRGPNIGRQWQLRQLVVAGPTKGTVKLYAAAHKPTATTIIGLKDVTSTRWPAPAFYGTHQFMLLPRDDLWVVVTGATATTLVIASGTAEDYDFPTAYRPEVAL